MFQNKVDKSEGILIVINDEYIYSYLSPRGPRCTSITVPRLPGRRGPLAASPYLS